MADRKRLDLVDDTAALATRSAIRRQPARVYVEECEALGIKISVDDVMIALLPAPTPQSPSRRV